MYTVLDDPKSMNHTFELNPDLSLKFSTHDFSNRIKQVDIIQNPTVVDPKFHSAGINESIISSDSLELPDFSNACLRFISDILHEDLEESAATVQDFSVLQDAEKSLYDVLGVGEEQTVEGPDIDFDGILCSVDGNGGNVNGSTSTIFGPNFSLYQTPEEPFLTMGDVSQLFLDLNSQPSGTSNSFNDLGDGGTASPVSTFSSAATVQKGKFVNHSRRKKNHQMDRGEDEEGRSSKHQASCEEYVELEQYDDILLYKEDQACPSKSSPDEVNEKLQKKGSKGGTSPGKKQYNELKEVDLRNLLSNCAQAVSNFDLRSANDILKQIRQHSSPYGDSLQRLAHHFANGLEARLAGTGSTVSTNFVDLRISSSDFLKAYKLYVSSIPFKKVTFFMANNAILKLVKKATRIHIITFGIFMGLQWPYFIQELSERPTGPPQLRITGIEHPQTGFRPAERVKATGHRLSGYCDRFNVPFQYNAIAQNWETIQVEDLKIESDELLIVDCVDRSKTLLDETIETSCPKDDFLKLIRKINPQLFIHGTLYGTFNTPFFVTRFREALYHYSSAFDMLEATMPRESHERLLLESEIYGKQAFNVIACEGAERIQRPETYKQWHVRTTRVGLRQLPLDPELMDRAKAMVKAKYHKDFVVDEDRNWMLQGWKGRIFCALSFWEPN